jgi:hypothetical protein
MPVIPVNNVVDKKRKNGKKWRAEEEEWKKGSLTKKNALKRFVTNLIFIVSSSAF